MSQLLKNILLFSAIAAPIMLISQYGFGINPDTSEVLTLLIAWVLGDIISDRYFPID